MQTQHRLKHWLSHLIEVPVAEHSTPHNAHLKVVLHRGRYKLITDGAIYSFGDLYSNYRIAFERFHWNTNPVKTCLVLGLGLGSIPDMLSGRFHQQIEFTAVEIDEVVTSLAFTYVLNPKNIKVQVFTADAASFLEWHNGRYDMICSDVFVGDHIPISLETPEALLAMKRMLNPKGVLLYNRLSRYPPDMEKSLKFRDEVFLPVFPEGGYMDVEGNWMFVNRLTAFST